jgi:transcriptional regulator with XRE-family HTH domain
VSDSADRPPLSRRIDQLFRTSRPEGRRWTNDEAAAQLKQRHPDLRVSGAYLSALRTGKRVRPSHEILSALAEFFGVSVAYFHDPDYADRAETQLAMLAEMNESGVRAIALRAVGLPAESVEVVTTILDQIRRQQGLPPVQH